MTVSEVIRKRDHLNNCIQTLRSGKAIDNDVLADFLLEYYDLLGALPVQFTEVR